MTEMIADTVLRGGAVIALDGWTPGAVLDRGALPEAIAIAEGRVLAIGTDEQIARHVAPGTEVIELDGRTVIPGIIDGHLHFTAYCLAYNGYISIRPGDLSSWEGLADRFGPDDVGSDGWLRFHGWHPLVLGRVGTRHDVDAALRVHGLEDVPAVLYDWSGHQLIAGSAALAAAGIDAGTPVPTGGVIGREPDGAPDGHLGDGAMALLNAVMPAVPADALREAYLAGQRQLLGLGIVGLTEPGLGSGAPALLDGSGTWRALDLLAELAEEEALRLRITALLLFAGTGGASVALYRDGLASGVLERFRARGIDESRLRVGGAKIFSDGVPMNHTSWFHEPYGPENDRGALVIVGDSEQARLNELHELVRMLNAHDLQAGIHAIGDAAADAAAEAIAAAQDTTGHRDLRHYLIHASVVRDSTVTLMREHGIGWTANPVISRLGRDAGGLEPGDSSSKERLRTILSRGGRPCLVTDSPIVSPDWRPNVVHAVTRSQFYRDRTDADDEGITGLDALALLTLMPAWQQHAEDERGTLAPGSLADLVVLGGTWPDDERIEELLDLPADQTYVGGVLVHERVRDVVG